MQTVDSQVCKESNRQSHEKERRVERRYSATQKEVERKEKLNGMNLERERMGRQPAKYHMMASDKRA